MSSEEDQPTPSLKAPINRSPMEEDLFKGFPEEQRNMLLERMHSYQDMFRIYNYNQREQKIHDVLLHFPKLDRKSAQLAILACRKNEVLLAIKRMQEDHSFKATVVAMASGECPLDFASIAFIDKYQEIRDALTYEPEDAEDNDSDCWEMEENYQARRENRSKRRSPHEKYDEGSDEEFICRKRSKGEKRLPRLCLDEALVMLANQTKQIDNTIIRSPTKEKRVITHKLSTPSEDFSTSTEHSETNLLSDTISTDSLPSVKRSKKNDDIYTPEGSEDSSDFEVTETGCVNNPKRTKIAKSLSHEKELFRTLSGTAANKLSVDSLRQLGWSDARIKAFRNREKNPNMYYYRFNDPGEPQATGKWNGKDKALFMKMVKEKGIDYQWGIFSINIPGRVGYQCSNFYRYLIKEGEIKDDNYSISKDGKLMFLFKDKRGISTLKRTGSKRKSVYSDDDDEVSNNDYSRTIEDEISVLPNTIDPMTMQPVDKPMISSYGHVMGYDTWVRVLNREPKNTCPFTKMKVTRRSLVKLTFDNIEEYRDKIIEVHGYGV